MSSFRVRIASLLSIVLTLALSTACGGGGSDKNPPGAQVLTRSATAMGQVASLSLTLRTSGNPDVKVKSVDAKLLKSGNSQGSVQVSELGIPIQLDFVVLDKTVQFKGLTGGWQTEPLSKISSIYDPSAVLDPGRGLVQLLRTAKDATTRGKDKVAGQDSYRVHATLAHDTVARLVPGLNADAPADIWIAAKGDRVLKAEVEAPAKGGGKPGKVLITFADYGKAFTITAPAK